MTDPLRIGDTGKTTSVLNPMGKVFVNDRAVEASTEGGLIGVDEDVVIVGGSTGRVVVRAVSAEAGRPPNAGDPLPAGNSFVPTPLDYPPAWVERIPAVAVGLAIGVLLVPAVWWFGTPLTPAAALVPVTGIVAGWIFRAFVSTALAFAAPREDHRPQAIGTAVFVVAGSVIGAAIGLNVAPGFVGLACGLAAGALAGGVVAYVGCLIVSMM